MYSTSRSCRGRAYLWVLVAVLALVPALAAPCVAQGFEQVNLVSNVDGLAQFTDPNLVNPWGFVFTPNELRVSDNGSGLSTLYGLDGTLLSTDVNIPTPTDPTGGTPTGMVRNPTRSFAISDGVTTVPARFIWATEDGTIVGWNPDLGTDQAIIAVDNSAFGAVYKGLARVRNSNGDFLYATNFAEGVVEVYDGDFNFVGSFTDPDVPARFAPFGIKNFDGFLYVTFAKREKNGTDDVPGRGNGFVDAFDADGNLVQRVITREHLNSPWGMAIVPEDFPEFPGALLVGNFGNGRIHAFDINTGEFLGVLRDPNGDPIVIDGLWGLAFHISPLANEEGGRVLYFTAGINDEQDGLLGILKPFIQPCDGGDAELP